MSLPQEVEALCPYCGERVMLQLWYDLETSSGRLVAQLSYSGKHTCPPVDPC